MNDLTTVDANELQELEALLGTQTSSGGGDGPALVRVPELKINNGTREKETKKKIPEGTFFIKGKEQKVYAEEVTFRPLASHIQFFHWGDVEGERQLINKSVPIVDMREEPVDMLGTIACGMPSWDERKDMEYAESKFWRDMQNRVTRGLVSYTGKTADGEEVTYENEPVIMYHKNSAYSGFYKHFIRVLPKGKKIHQYQAKMTLEYNENGSVIWHTPVYDVDLSNPLPITQDIFDTMRVFAETIKEETKYVRDAYFKALSEGAIDQKAIDALGDSLDNDLEDVA